jgi:hypothetical protein
MEQWAMGVVTQCNGKQFFFLEMLGFAVNYTQPWQPNEWDVANVFPDNFSLCYVRLLKIRKKALA